MRHLMRSGWSGFGERYAELRERQKVFLSNYDEQEILDKVKEFRLESKLGMTRFECMDRMHSIFGDICSFPIRYAAYNHGTIFYRARAIPADDVQIPLRTLSKSSDAWEPPPEFVKVQGRLNDIGQSILYCCPYDPALAIQEARASSNKHVAVMVYQAKRDIRVSVIGSYEASDLPKDAMTRLFYSFLEEEFARFAPIGNEHEYIVTTTVADSYFNYPDQDAWCYRSVQSEGKFNVAFLPGKSKDAVQLVGVLLCDNSAHEVGSLKVLYVVDFDPDTDLARYHRIGSKEQKKIFPDFGLA